MSPLEARLAALAAAQQTTTYGVLARELGVRMADLTTALEALMAQDAATSRPLQAVLCAGRLNNDQPAQGFFMAAAALGFDISDPAAFVANHRNRLFLEAK